jgi:5-bromo-4-chloroindolyl phosphate hydrolysis protein
MLANLITTKKCSFATLKSSKHRWTKIVLRNQSLSITRKLLDEKDKQIIKNFAQILSELILVGEAL